MNVLLLRHGKTAGNLEERYVGRTDEPLAEETYKLLKSLTPEKLEPFYEKLGPVAAIYTSPMRRCMETAEALFPQSRFLQVPRGTVLGLEECDFGRFEYKTWKELSGDPEYEKFLNTQGMSGFPGGETTEAFKERVCSAFSSVLKGWEDGTNGAPWKVWKDGADSAPWKAREEGINGGSRKVWKDGADSIPLKMREGRRNGTLVFVVHGGTIMAALERFSRPHRDYYSWQTGSLCGFLGEAGFENGRLFVQNIAEIKIV